MIYLIGSGGQGKVVAEILLARGYGVEVLDNDPRKVGAPFLQSKVKSEEQTLLSLSHPALFFVGVGDSAAREQATRRWLARGHELVTAVHPTAIVSPSAKLGLGVCVMAGAVIQADARIGEGCIVNTGALVDHDCNIGDFSHIAPGAVLGGNVSVGESTWIGLGARVIQGQSVGSQSLIGAGAVVVDDIPDQVVAYGTPCRVARSLELASV